MKRYRMLIFVLVTVGLIFTAGCAQGNNPEPEPKTAAVEILSGAYAFDEDSNNDYSPNVLHVEVGMTVTWKNNDTVFHTVDTHDGILSSEQINPGESWSYTFTQEGVYKYHCHPHPWMTGKIIVGDVDENDLDHGEDHDTGHDEEDDPHEDEHGDHDE